MISRYFASCIACGNTSLINLSGFSKTGLVKCGVCGLVFCRQNPSEKELDDFYSRYPPYGFISPVTYLRYNQLLDLFSPYKKTGNLLDVGCGDGFFLDEAKKRGWAVYGTEYMDKSIAICSAKGIRMNKGPLNAENYPADFFDIVTSFEVLEHINTPGHEIRQMQKILREKGILYITTPNFNSLSRRILQSRWSIITYPEHLVYFTPASLNYILSKNGLKKISMKSTGISIGRLLHSLAPGSQKAPAREYQNTALNPDQKLRGRMEKNFFLSATRSILNFIFSAFGCGDTLKATYVRITREPPEHNSPF